MTAQQMSIINLNMIGIIKVSLEEQRVPQQLLTPNNQQRGINQQSNLLRYISSLTLSNTQPQSNHLTEEQYYEATKRKA